MSCHSRHTGCRSNPPQMSLTIFHELARSGGCHPQAAKARPRPDSLLSGALDDKDSALLAVAAQRCVDGLALGRAI